MMTLSCHETSAKSYEHYSHFVSSQDPPSSLQEERGLVSSPGGLGTRLQRVMKVILYSFVLLHIGIEHSHSI